MARRFLTHLDMAGNQILNASFEKLTTTNEPTTGLFDGRIYYNTTDEVLKVYTTTDGWLPVGAITDIQGTTNEIEVSIDAQGVATIGLPDTIHADVVGAITGNADTASALETARNIAISGPVNGNADFDGSADITINVTQANDSVTLGTHTTGDYVATVSGTANEIEVSGTGEGAAVTVGLPDDVTITNDLNVGGDVQIDGDLTVSGTTTTVNTETILLADNIITLNSNFASDPPTENAGIEVERGTVENNVALRWNETTDVWEATLDGTNYSTVLLSGDASSTDINDFVEAAQDAVGAALTDTSTIDFTYTDGSDTIEAAVILAAGGGLTDSSGVAVDYTTVEAQLVTDGFTKKAAADVGDTTSTSFQITHSLGTRDVVVNVYDNTSFDTVEADVVRTDANNVTVSFTTAPGNNEYRVVIIG
jgi:hypothetical protein